MANLVGPSVNFFKERNAQNIQKTRELCKILPSFCEEFFIGIENKTTPLTRLNYAQDLKIFFSFLASENSPFARKDATSFSFDDLNQITATHIEKFLSYLSDYSFAGKQLSNTKKTKARKLSSIRSFFKYFFNKDKLIANVAAKVEVPKINEKEIVRLEVDEVVKILNLAESGTDLSGRQQAFHKNTKLRDVALLTLLLGTGIRVSECVGLNVEDIDFNTYGFKITRKGGNRVVLYFSDEVEGALRPYLAWRQEQVDKKQLPADEKALFLSLQKQRMGIRAVEKLVKKYSEVIAPLKKITPHKLRSTYGTNLYKETKDIYIVADVLGHKDVNTTRKHYAAQSDDIRREAASKVRLR